MNKPKADFYFTVESFMYRKKEDGGLGLGGKNLLVFAFIHSFTRGDDGLYWGSQEFLAKYTCMSLSTAKRVIARLKEMGYIEKYETAGLVGLRSTVGGEASGDTVGCKHDTLEDCGRVRKNSIEDSLLSLSEADTADAFAVPTVCKRPAPKYTFISFGREDIVHMTKEQYESLLRLVDQDKLAAYVRKLELLMMNQGYRTFNPCLTIKKWILADSKT